VSAAAARPPVSRGVRWFHRVRLGLARAITVAGSWPARGAPREPGGGEPAVEPSCYRESSLV
jgi:hypothetical protein